MKILILPSSSNPRQATFRIPMRTAALMAEKGHDVTVLVSRAKARPKPVDAGDARVCYTPALTPYRFRRNGFGLVDAAAMTWAALRGKFDVVHTITGHRPARFVAALAAKYLRGSVIVDEWWEWFGREGIARGRRGLISRCVGVYDSLMELPAKRPFDGVIAITNVLKERLGSGADAVVLHGGSECDRFVTYEKAEAREALGLSSDLFLVGMSNLAREDHRDNLVFLEALARRAADCPGLRLVATGDPRYAEERLGSLFPPGVLIHHGWPDLETYNRLLCACDVFALPYPDSPRNAGRWPNKFGDYVALNRPVISNPTGELSALFRDYRLGWLCENQAEQYAGVLDDLLTNRSDLAEACADSAELARDLLAFPLRVERILAYYEELREKRGVGR